MKPELAAALKAATASLVVTAVPSISSYRNQISFRLLRDPRPAIAASHFSAFRDHFLAHGPQVRAANRDKRHSVREL